MTTGARVLFVEDSEAIRESVVDALAAAGYAPAAAVTAAAWRTCSTPSAPTS